VKHVEFGEGEGWLEYELRRSERKTLGIAVEPDGRVVATAPADASLERIEAALRRKRRWIGDQLRHLAQLPPPPRPREWVAGETHRYLGRQYRLKVLSGSRREVKLVGGHFRVVLPDPGDRDDVRRLMERWYLDHARTTFQRRLEGLVRETPILRLRESPPLLVRRMKRRWGSCSPEGRILMNVEAVKLPIGGIDYLLMHELCHLRVPHHGAAFWRLLGRCPIGSGGVAGWSGRRCEKRAEQCGQHVNTGSRLLIGRLPDCTS
jgi:hypothetical protein